MTSVLANSQAVAESRKDSEYEKERLELLAMKHVSRTLSMSGSANSGVVDDSSSSDSSSTSSSSTSSSNKSKPSTSNNNSRPISSTFLDQLMITSSPLNSPSTKLNNDDDDSDENSQSPTSFTCDTGGNPDEAQISETLTKATLAKVQKKSPPSPRSSPRQQPKKNAKASTATRSRAASVSSSTTATAKTATTMSSVKRASRAMSLISDATGSSVATAKKNGSLTQKSSNGSLRRTDSSNSLAGTDKKSSVSQQKPKSMTLPGSKSSAKVSSAAEPELAGGGKLSPSGRSNSSTPILRAKTLPGPPSTTAATKLNRRASAAASMRKSVVKSEISSTIDPQPTGRNASPAPSNFTITDMNLEDLDMDQLEKLFLNSVAGSTGNRSPSILSNYSSYVPWKPGIPIEPSDPLLAENGSVSRNYGTRVPSSDTFTEPDEQFRAGLSLIQEAFNRKSTSLKRELEENKKQKPTTSGRVGEKENNYQARIRELSDALAKEEAEKNALVISKNALLERYNKLWDEHRYCASKVAGKTTASNKDSIVPVLHSGRVEIRNYLQTLEESERQALLDEFLEACHPHDIHMQQATLDYYVKTTFDIIGTLPTELGTQILSQLCAEDLCKSRIVSKRWREMVNEPNLWKSKCLAATREDPEPLAYPSDPSQWETVYHGLHYREHNWATGNVQSIKFLKGHTASVTALKLKKSTLVTGSYDETVRIWDMKTGKCTKVLQGKAVSCVDFLPELRIVTAGFNDQGRPHVWHMDSGEIIQTLNGHNRGTRSISMNEKYVVTAGQDMSVIVWNWKDGTKLQTFRSIGNMLLGVQLIGEDKIVVVSIDGWIRTFSVDNKNELHKYKIPEANGIQWFSAFGLDFVCATSRTIYQLRWPNKYVKTGRRTEKNQDEVIVKPELTQDPMIRHKITSAAEIWCGTTDNRKQRIIVSTRFNSRTHNNKSIYVHTLERGMNRFAGLWERMSDHMATQNMGPMCMDVDHEKVVVGATGGMVYVMGFVGDRVDKIESS